MVPKVAGWSLTKACNLKCQHCYNASGKQAPDELTLEEAIEVVAKLKDFNVEAINFGGGECALRPDFIDLCRYIKSQGMKISYTTNGTVTKRFSDHLHLFDDIGVSLDFAHAERHDWFRGRQGTFKQAIETLEYLVQKGIDTEIVTCITSLNALPTELQKIYALAKSIGVNYWRLNRFRENGRGIENKNSLALSKEELKTAYLFLSEYTNNAVSVPDPLFRAAYGGKYSLKGDPSGNSAFRIQHNGEVTPSVFLGISGGNIKTDSLEDIFNSPIFRSIRNREPCGKCLECEAYSHCLGGDAGASYIAYGHFNGPDPMCWLTSSDKKGFAYQENPKNWNVHELYLCTVYIPIGEKNAA